MSMAKPAQARVPVLLKSSSQQTLERVVHRLWISLAARGSHHLADEKFEYSLVARAILRQIVGIFLDHFASPTLDLARIAHLRESFRRDDFRSGFARLKHPREHLL